MPRRSAKPLTAKGIINAKPPKSGYVESFDAAMPGMCLRVMASGVKSYIISARVKGKQTRAVIGRAAGPFAITLKEARRLAADAKDRAAMGLPLLETRAPAPIGDGQAMTFGDVADEYIKRECARLARGHEIESIIRRELLPHWRDVPLMALRKRHARAITDAVAETRPAAAGKVHECYKRIFSWALDFFDDDELGTEVSPFAGLKASVSKAARDRILADAELSLLWEAWDAIGYPFGDLQKVLLLTGQRRDEVAGMSWSEIDLAAAEWRIPAERTKSARDHLVPLSRQVVAVLSGIDRFAGGDYVFTTTGGRRPVSGYSKAKAKTDTTVKALLAEAVPAFLTDGDGNMKAWRWHDLRRTARTGMAELGVPEIIGERILNHAPRGLSGIYNRAEYRDEKRDALERWAMRVQEIITPPPANVTPLRRVG